MNTTTRFFLGAAMVCLLAAGSYAQGFEGAITMKLNVPMMKMENEPMNILVKNGKSVTTMNLPMMGESKIYTDAATQTRVMVMGKTGYSMDMKQLESAAKVDSLKIKPVATGQTKTVNGYSAELYTASTKDGGELDFWLTKEFPKDLVISIAKAFGGSLGGMSKGMGAANPMDDLMSKGYAPVEVEVKMGGAVQVTMDFVKFEKKHVDDDVFVIPADVTVSPMPTMPGNRGASGSGGGK